MPIREKDFERIVGDGSFDKMPEGEKQRFVATRNNVALLTELRLIRWLLLGIAVMLFFAIRQWWPDWWHLP